MNAKLHQADLLIDNYQFEEAQRILEKYDSSNLKDHQNVHYLKAKLLMRTDNSAEAISIYNENLSFFGLQTRVLADLCCSYYSSGDTLNWQRTFEKLKDIFILEKNKLSKEYTVRTLSLLGQFSEITGELHDAIQYYKKALEQYSNSDFTDEFNYKIRAQLLRLQCETETWQNQRQNYTVLNQLVSESVHLNFDVEINFNLMTADFYLISPEVAIHRAELLIANHKLDNRDKILFSRSLSYNLAINSVSKYPDWAINTLETNTDSKSSTGLIHQALLAKSNQELNKLCLNALCIPMTTSERLRLFNILLIKVKDNSQTSLIAKATYAQLEGLSVQSRKLWLATLSKHLPSPMPTIKVDLKNRFLFNDETRIELAKKPTLWSLLNLFVSEDSLTITQCTQALWKQKPNIQNLKKLKMQISRLNEALYPLTNETSSVSINSRQIEFKPNIDRSFREKRS